MDRRSYEKPEVKFVALRGADAVASVCWAFAVNNKEFFLDYEGPGYLQITMAPGARGCDGGTIQTVAFYNKDGSLGHNCTPGDGHYEKVAAGVALAEGNSAEPFTGSPFSQKVDNSWS